MMTTPETPKCDKCGIEITTGVQASLCPLNEECELWPTDASPEARLLMWSMWAFQAVKVYKDIRGQRDQLKAALEDFIDNTYLPEPNCGCHIAPPCDDCVVYGKTREMVNNARAELAALRK